jgi:alpha-mannosidase
VVLDVIKKAEDSNDIIMRLYEAYGGHARARLVSSLAIKKMAKCNILEDELEEMPTNRAQGMSQPVNRTFSTNLRVLDDDIVELQQQAQQRQQAEGILIKLKPFEVLTLKLSL